MSLSAQLRLHLVTALADALMGDELSDAVDLNTTNVAALLASSGSGNMGTGQLIGKTVFVSTVDDLPDAVGGVHTLADGVTYVPMTLVDLGTDVLETAGNSAIAGFASDNSGFITANATALLTSSDTIVIHDCSMQNTLGPVFALTPGSGKNVHLDSVDVDSAVAVDTMTGTAGTKELGIHGCHWQNGSLGLVVAGAWEDLDMTTTAFRDMDASATFLTLAAGATFDICIIDDCFFITDDAGQTGLDIDSAIAPTAEGEIRGCAFTGPGTFLDAGGIDQTTVGWWLGSNPGIEDSAAIGVIDFDGNSTATVITDGSSWHAINGSTFTLAAQSERFDEPSEGQLRYTGKDPKRMVVIVEMTVETAANNKLCNVRLRQYDASATTTSTIHTFDIDIRSTTQPQSKSHAYVVDLYQNDYIFLEIGSSDGTNMTVLEANMLTNVA